MNNFKKGLIALGAVLVAIGITVGVVLYYRSGTTCEEGFDTCVLKKDLVFGVYGYSYDYTCGNTTIRMDRTGLWTFVANGTEFTKTGLSSLVIPTWSFTLNGTDGQIGYALSITEKYQVTWGNINWNSDKTFLPVTFPSSLSIQSGSTTIAKYNKRSLALPNIKYTVCVINHGLSEKEKLLVGAAATTYAIGKKDT